MLKSAPEKLQKVIRTLVHLKIMLSSAFMTPIDTIPTQTIRLLITTEKQIMYSTFRQMIFRQNFPKPIKQQNLYIPQNRRNYGKSFVNVNLGRIGVPAVPLRFWSILIIQAILYSKIINIVLTKWCTMLCWMLLKDLKTIII